jgi:tyrosine-protein phosphatase YwqE
MEENMIILNFEKWCTKKVLKTLNKKQITTVYQRGYLEIEFRKKIRYFWTPIIRRIKYE